MLNLNPCHGHLEGGGIYLWIRLFEMDIQVYYDQILQGGIQVIDPLKDQFWGDRSFVIKDCNNYILAFNQLIQK